MMIMKPEQVLDNPFRCTNEFLTVPTLECRVLLENARCSHQELVPLKRGM